MVLNHLKKIRTNKKGDAMIVAVCIMAVLVALTMAMLLSLSVYVAGTRKLQTGSQVKELAVSFSKLIEADMTADYSKADEENPGLRSYIRNAIEGGSWQYYNELEAGHEKELVKRTFHLNDVAGYEKYNVDDMTITMWWSKEEDVAIPYDGSSLDIQLSVTGKGQTQIITTSYHLTISDGGPGGFSKWSWTKAWRG